MQHNDNITEKLPGMCISENIHCMSGHKILQAVGLKELDQFETVIESPFVCLSDGFGSLAH